MYYMYQNRFHSISTSIIIRGEPSERLIRTTKYLQNGTKHAEE